MDMAKENAIKALANKCNAEMKLCDPNDLIAMAGIMTKYEPTIKALGLSRVQFMVEIRYINHPEKDRRMQ